MSIEYNGETYINIVYLNQANQTIELGLQAVEAANQRAERAEKDLEELQARLDRVKASVEFLFTRDASTLPGIKLTQEELAEAEQEEAESL